MLDVLRQMTRAELAEVFAVVGEPLGPPEEVPRILAGAPWLLWWGPGDPERAVLMRAARALGLGHELRQNRWTTPVLERRVYVALCAQALGSADVPTRASLLARLGALTGPPCDDPHNEEARQVAALRACLGTPEGLRAFSALPEALELAPQFDLTRPTPLAVLAGMVSSGGWGGGARAVRGFRSSRGLDLRALFRVLTLCWRARQRLLLEQRAEAARLKNEIKAIAAQLRRQEEDSLLERRALPWYRQPAAALGIAGGASFATAVQMIALGEPHPLSLLVGLLALVGAFGTAVCNEAARFDAATFVERRALLTRLHQLRAQLGTARRQIAHWEQ